MPSSALYDLKVPLYNTIYPSTVSYERTVIHTDAELTRGPESERPNTVHDISNSYAPTPPQPLSPMATAARLGNDPASLTHPQFREGTPDDAPESHCDICDAPICHCDVCDAPPTHCDICDAELSDAQGPPDLPWSLLASRRSPSPGRSIRERLARHRRDQRREERRARRNSTGGGGGGGGGGAVGRPALLLPTPTPAMACPAPRLAPRRVERSPTPPGFRLAPPVVPAPPRPCRRRPEEIRRLTNEPIGLHGGGAAGMATAEEGRQGQEPAVAVDAQYLFGPTALLDEGSGYEGDDDDEEELAMITE
jgi:hypothetical protein